MLHQRLDGRRRESTCVMFLLFNFACKAIPKRQNSSNGIWSQKKLANWTQPPIVLKGDLRGAARCLPHGKGERGVLLPDDVCSKQDWAAHFQPTGLNTPPYSRVRTQIREFMNYLEKDGPSYGYFPEPSKSILIIAPENKAAAQTS
jgi:hypothetical protein